MELLNNFINSIKIEETYITKYPRFILICGGEYNVSKSTFISLRNYILSSHDQDIINCCYCPEDFTDWINDALYPDLIEFEKDFASISSEIIVCLETAGSIAEFGVFSQIPEIAQKMLVILDKEESQKDTFINLGPIRYIEHNYNKKNISVYNVIPNKMDREKFFNKQKDDLLNDIKELFHENYPKRSKFNRDNISHIFLLIYESIEYFTLLKFSEIKEALEKKGFCIEEKRLKQLLFLMQQIKFIEKFKYGHDEYYKPSISDNKYRNCIKLSFIDGSQWIDKVRSVFNILENYKTQDPRRYRAIS